MSKTGIAFLTALTLWSCAKNPVTGKKELMFVSETQEIQMGNHLLLEDRVEAGTLLKTVTRQGVPPATQ